MDEVKRLLQVIEDKSDINWVNTAEVLLFVCVGVVITMSCRMVAPLYTLHV